MGARSLLLAVLLLLHYDAYAHKITVGWIKERKEGRKVKGVVL